MTPNLQVVYDYLEEAYNLTMEVPACRRIGDSRTWSQHAFNNAVDVYTQDRDTADHIEFSLRAQFGQNIRNILTWRYNAAHWNHVHVDMWPKGVYTPPCAGGKLRIQYRNQDIGDAIVVDEFPLTIKEEDMPLNQLDRAIVDIAFALGADGDRTYWYGLDRGDSAFKDIAAAVRREAPAILAAAGSVDKTARASASRANARLNNLHKI